MNIGTANMEANNEVSEDIMRCLQTLYTTAEGSQPMDRDFGLDTSIVGKPVEVVKNLYTLDVIEKTEKYEPRVKIKEVTFEISEGTLIPTIHFERGGESNV